MTDEFDITMDCCNFTGEIGRIDPLLNGYTPALLSFFLVYNLNGGIMGKHNKTEMKCNQQFKHCFFVLEKPKRGHSRMGLFRCECGKYFTTAFQNVIKGRTRSCGCYQKKKLSERKTHGLSKSRIYRRYRSMLARCYYKSNPSYKNYGGRGICVCDEWRDSFTAFYDFVMSLSNAMDIGYTIDRINNDGNYEPGNIRWATYKEQIKNRRKPIYIHS